MFGIVFSKIKGSFSLLLYFLNTVCLCGIIYLIYPFKFIIPMKPVRDFISSLIIQISTLWISVNVLITKLTTHIKWDIRGIKKVYNIKNSLVISNHQSWADIVVLQTVFNGKIPFLKFFLKKELIWVPFLGIVWWILDFPFMKRYTHAYIKKHPHMKGKDLEITKKACRKFINHPVSIMNFVEGTRFTETKFKRQEVSYKNLLKPKAGGIAYVLSAMSDSLTDIINVTITYQSKHNSSSIWEMICGNITHIRVDIDVIPVEQELQGDYFNDPVFKDYFQDWLNTVWKKKDMLIETIKDQKV